MKLQLRISLYWFLVFPFLKPEIVSSFTSLAPINTAYNVWRVISIGMILFLIGKNRIFTPMMILTGALYLVYLIPTIINSGSSMKLIMHGLSLFAITGLISLARMEEEEDELLHTIVFQLAFLLIINAITIFLFYQDGGLHTDFNEELYHMRSYYYFLGYDNRHIHFIMPYLGLSLAYDMFYVKRIRMITIITHILVAIAVFLTFSATTMVAVALFYFQLIFMHSTLARKMLNPFFIIVSNIVISILIGTIVNLANINNLAVALFGKTLYGSRAIIWIRYSKYISDAMAFGNGYRDSIERFTFGLASHAHNMVLEILYIGGIAGLICFIVILYYSMHVSRMQTICEDQYSEDIDYILLSAIFSYLVALQATASEYCPAFFMLLGFTYYLRNRECETYAVNYSTSDMGGMTGISGEFKENPN